MYNVANKKQFYFTLEVPSWLWHLSGGTDIVVRWFLSLYGNISPHLNVSCNFLLPSKLTV